LTLRVFAHGYNGWNSKLLSLDDLIWQEKASPYGLSLHQTWGQDFRERWIKSTSSDGMRFETSRSLFNELDKELNLKVDYYDFMGEAIPNLVNMVISLKLGYPIGSSQNNLLELANTFLSSKARYQYADIFIFFVKHFNRKEILERASIQKKIKVAKSEPQTSKGAMASKVLHALFDDWAK
jgi:hypothetical protein